ncbi:MAG: pilus assembly PilX N-terminal domain-containing protein [Candidatus Margulisiibacteriota bacterium]
MKKGFTLIGAIFIVLVMTLLAITTSTFISSDAVIAVKNYHSQDAFYIASAGVEYYLKQLDGDADWSTPPSQETKSFSGGVLTITTTNEQRNRITFTVTGLVTSGATTYRRGIRSTIQRMGGGLGSIAEDYVLYMGGTGSGTGETNIGNNVTINGSILVDSDVDIGNNTTISGDAQVSGDITGDTTGITGSAESGSTMPEEPPSLESTYYDNELATAATYSPADKEYAGGKTVSGTTYVNGNIVFKQNCTINVTGTATIVATGTILVRNNSTFGDYLHVIAGGLITMENNISIGKYGVWYSSVGFDVGNNEIVGDVGVGEGTAFLTPGDIDFGNNCSFDGFLYAGGTLSLGNNTDFSGLIVAGYVEDIGENSTFDLNPDVIDWDGLVGFEGTEGQEETHLTDWDEVY